jgi:hypothetical protein
MQVRNCIIAVVGMAFLALPAPADDETTRAISAIKSIAREGKGNDDAGPAWKTIVSKGNAALMPTLEAFDDANPTAANWLRTAVDAIADGEKAAGRKLPADKLETFVTNTQFAASARLVAFELLTAQEPSAKARLLPGFINDKSPDLRHQAVELALEKLEKGDKTALKPGLEKLFTYARDKDQVDLLAKKLGELGTKVSVCEQFAFITQLSLVGPFDSTGGKGFLASYPPEKAMDTSGGFKGKNDAALTWKAVETTDTYGTFDINKLLDKHKDSAVYALATIVSEKETTCDIRVTSTNAVQIFLNGKKLAEREEYHHGAPLDANIGKGTLKKGENAIVLKVCQNNQSEPWAQNWQFQVRVCDSTGGPIAGLLQKSPKGGKEFKLGYIDETLVPKEPKEEKK